MIEKVIQKKFVFLRFRFFFCDFCRGRFQVSCFQHERPAVFGALGGEGREKGEEEEEGEGEEVKGKRRRSKGDLSTKQGFCKKKKVWDTIIMFFDAIFLMFALVDFIIYEQISYFCLFCSFFSLSLVVFICFRPFLFSMCFSPISVIASGY